MIDRVPPLNTLRAFEAAARHLSFKTAASEIGVTAGAISQLVKKLERALGVELFRRLPRGLLLTLEGEKYLPKITKMFEDLTVATETIAPEMNGKKFNVGICSKAIALLPTNWPNHSDSLKRNVRECVQTTDIDLIRTNELDCLVRLGGGPYGGLALVIIPDMAASGECARELHLVCKPGLVDCHQSKAIVDDLKVHFAKGN